jgi:hypothetical protein
MITLDDLKTYARFAWGLPGFLRQTVTLEEAKAAVVKRLAEREDNFLRLVERGIFGYAGSPYLPLLRLAQVEMGDIRSMVRDKGLETTLQALYDAGVCVTFEEFKGRKPIVRDGQTIPVQAKDFDNPYLQEHFYGRTGGTSGAGTRVPIDLDRIRQQAPYRLLNLDAHELDHTPMALWLGTLPDHTGTSAMLKQSYLRRVPDRWYSPTMGRGPRPALKHRATTAYMVRMARLAGIPIPQPQPLGLDEAVTIARWASTAIATHGACLVEGVVSGLVRVCIAAREQGLDLTGTTLIGGGEPPTPVKIRQMTSVGARFIPGYWFAEVGVIGMGCAAPVDNNDIHLFKDALALIQAPCEVPFDRPTVGRLSTPPGSTLSVDAFCFTTLLPTASKLLLNVQSDDYGLVEDRTCGCSWEALGFTQHVRQIRSFRKLTGEAVTLVGSEMVRILEETLPARFGGTSQDYQLMEEEDVQGLTRLSLVVSPSVPLEHEDEVIETVLKALQKSSVAANFAQTIWRQAKSLRVVRREPVWTARGKLMPLHLAGRREQQ